jgi:beta-lactamase regulating signal transducer with metallopeptidase domain
MSVVIDELSRTWGAWVAQGIAPAAILFAGLCLLEFLPWRPPARLRMALWAVVLLRPFWPAALGVPAAVLPAIGTEWLQPPPPRDIETLAIRAPEPAGKADLEADRALSSTSASDPASRTGPSPSPGSIPSHSWVAAAFVTWGTGISAWLILRILRSHRFRKRLELRAPPPPLEERLRSWMEEAGHATPAAGRILISGNTVSPLALGVFRPIIVIPEALLESKGLRSVVLHEAIHLRWRDPLVFALVDLLKIVNLPNPLPWLAARRLRDLAEEDCDAVSSRMIGDAREYAKALLDVSLGIAKGSAAIGFAEELGRTRLSRRIGKILSPPRPGSCWKQACGVAVWAGLAFLSLPASEAPKDAGSKEDRAIRIDLPGKGYVVADAISVSVDHRRIGLRSDPGREIEARVPLVWKEKGDAPFALLQTKELSIFDGPDESVALRAIGPVRLTLEDPAVTATAEGITAEASSPGGARQPSQGWLVRAENVDLRLIRTGNGKKDEVHLRAPSIRYRHASRVGPDGVGAHEVEATGGVEILGRDPQFAIRAERVLLRLGPADEKDSRSLQLEGNVRVDAPGLELECDRASLDGRETLHLVGNHRRKPLGQSRIPARLPFTRRIVLEGSPEIILDAPDGEGGVK